MNYSLYNADVLQIINLIKEVLSNKEDTLKANAIFTVATSLKSSTLIQVFHLIFCDGKSERQYYSTTFKIE